MGSVTERRWSHSKGWSAPRSGGCRCSPPLLEGRGSEAAERGAGDQVALKVEEVVDGGVAGEEALGGAGRLEALHLALSSPGRLVRILRPIVPSPPLLVPRREADRAEGGTVRAELVRHHDGRREALLLQQLA